MGNGRPERQISVTGPEMEYVIRVTTVVPVDRDDLCREIVENVYGPEAAVVISYGVKGES